MPVYLNSYRPSDDELVRCACRKGKDMVPKSNRVVSIEEVFELEEFAL